jgi:hypothetical protein
MGARVPSGWLAGLNETTETTKGESNMKRVLAILAAVPLFVLVARAQGQDDVRTRALQKSEEGLNQAMQMKMQAIGAVKGFTVKGAPYSGEEINETNQVLADGTRIHRETRATVYRDSEGRTRRETPDSVVINDPVAGTAYVLNPKTMTGQKLPNMAGFSFVRRGNFTTSSSVTSSTDPGTVSTFSMKVESDGGTPTITVNGQTLDQKKVQELLAQAKADGDNVMFMKEPLPPPHVIVGNAMAGPVTSRKPVGESLGKQTIEGVTAEGTRNVNTIKSGTIGNDRDIQVTGESWYSSELQTMIMSKHSDPRTGEESFRLTNINRNEPAAYLFQVPSGYTITAIDKK